MKRKQAILISWLKFLILEMRSYWLHYRYWTFSHSMLFSSNGGIWRETAALHSKNSLTVSVSYYSPHPGSNQRVGLSGRDFSCKNNSPSGGKNKENLCKPLSRAILPKMGKIIKMWTCLLVRGDQKDRKLEEYCVVSPVIYFLRGKSGELSRFLSQSQSCLVLWFKIQFSTSQTGNMISSLLYRFLWFALPFNIYIIKCYLLLSTAFEPLQ